MQTNTDKINLNRAQMHLDLIATQKQLHLIQKLYFELARLPLNMRKKVVENKLIHINEEIIDLSIKYDFAQQEVHTDNEALNYKKFKCEDVIIVLPIKSYSDYFNFGLNNEEKDLLDRWLLNIDSLLIDCPTVAKEYISDIVKYLAYLEYYILLLTLELSNNYSDDNIKKITSKINQLQTSLTDTQRGKLFDLLVLNSFISDKDKEGFVWAFGSENAQPANWEQIEWIDKSTTRHEPNAQTLFELLFLLGVTKNTDANNPENLYRKIDFCFKPLKNITVKNPQTTKQDTPRKKLLKKIIEEAQK